MHILLMAGSGKYTVPHQCVYRIWFHQIPIGAWVRQKGFVCIHSKRPKLHGHLLPQPSSIDENRKYDYTGLYWRNPKLDSTLWKKNRMKELMLYTWFTILVLLALATYIVTCPIHGCYERNLLWRYVELGKYDIHTLDAHRLITMLCDAPANVLVMHPQYCTSLTSQENKWLINKGPLTLSICVMPFLSWTKFGTYMDYTINNGINT